MWGFTECRTISGLLWSYTAHKLGEQEFERVERHLIGCGPCRAEAEAYQRTVDALASMRREQLPESRRGWHELRATLSSPAQQAAARRTWVSPMLAWGGAAAMAALALAVVTQSPQRNQAAAVPDEHRTTARSGGSSAAHQVAGALQADADTSMVDDAIDFINASPAVSEKSAARRAAVNPAPSLIIHHRPVRLAYGGSSFTPAHGSGRAVRGRRGGAPDYSHLDGRAQASLADNNNYVLTPVSASSESDSGEDYVMGSVVMSGRSSDPEVASRW